MELKSIVDRSKINVTTGKVNAWAAIIAAGAAVASFVATTYFANETLKAGVADRQQRDSELAKQFQFHRDLLRQELAEHNRRQNEHFEFLQQPHVAFPLFITTIDVVMAGNGSIEIKDKEKELESSVPILVNSGRGTARDIRVSWHTERIYKAADVQVPALREQDHPTRPVELAPGQAAGIYLLPECFQSNVGQHITFWKGLVNVKYLDLSDKEYNESYKATFTLELNEEKLFFVVEPADKLTYSGGVL